jgi:hypothetical protein
VSTILIYDPQVCKVIKRVIEAGGGDLNNFQAISERMAQGRVSRPDLDTVDDWFTRFSKHSGQK